MEHRTALERKHAVGQSQHLLGRNGAGKATISPSRTLSVASVWM